MAFHVDCYTQAKGRAPAKSFTARHAGTCVFATDGKCLHGGTIKPGDSISWARRGFHAKQAPQAPQVEAEEPEDNEQEEPQQAPRIAPVADGSIAQALAGVLLPLVQAQIDAKLGAIDPAALIREADKLIQAKIDALTLPRPIEIRRPDVAPVNVGVQHKQFPELLALLASGNHVAIIGEAGTGKTYAAEQAFTALGRGYNLIQAITDRHTEVYGFIDAHGAYHPSRVYDSFGNREANEPGKGLIVDEADGSDERELLSLNAATANGCMAFPTGMRRSGECFQVILNMNTWGTGATADFTGRARLDASSLDRFVPFYWELDEALERATCSDAEWCAYVQAVRGRVKARGLKHLVTPRASYKGARVIGAAMAQGMTRAQAVELATRTCLRRNLSDDQWRNVA